MDELKQTKAGHTSPQALNGAEQLALYDQYGAMAYGIILQIIPDPELAQRVLLDLFTSSPLTSRAEAPVAGEIIRLARAKSLAAKPVAGPSVLTPTLLPATDDTMDTAKLVFNLSFCQGCTPEAIAEKLRLSPTNVLKAFNAYFHYLRSS